MDVLVVRLGEGAIHTAQDMPILFWPAKGLILVAKKIAE
jgi:hypothetical protein